METPRWSFGGAKVVFPFLAKRFGLKTFIETGSGFGDTLAFVHPSFETLYSIEAYEWNYRLCKVMLEPVENIHMIYGNSGEELPKLLASIPCTPTLFWLDAHMVPGEDDGPLAAEIKAVMDYRPYALIAIDDVGVGAGFHHDPQLSVVRKTVSLDGWTLDYRFNRIMFMHRGQFDIPFLG